MSQRTSILRGRTALVTGASGGLGSDFARELAARGADLVLVARREDRLASLARELEVRHEVAAAHVALDLAARDAPARLVQRLAAEGRTIDVLVNNAGFGLHGRFLDIDWEREREMLDLDIVTLVHLTKLVVPGMVERRFGRVLHLASIGAYAPTPTYATYSAAKSFVLSFGEALHHELRGTGVTSTVLAPGITATDFLRVSGQSPTRYQRAVMMESGEVARIGIDHMLRGTPSVVSGRINSAFAWSNRLLPRRVTTAVAARLMR